MGMGVGSGVGLGVSSTEGGLESGTAGSNKGLSHRPGARMAGTYSTIRLDPHSVLADVRCHPPFHSCCPVPPFPPARLCFRTGIYVFCIST